MKFEEVISLTDQEIIKNFITQNATRFNQELQLRAPLSHIMRDWETEKSHCVIVSLLINWNNITSVTNHIKLISCLFLSKILAHLYIYIVLVSTIGNYIHIYIYSFCFEKVYDQELLDMFEDNNIN